MKTTVGNNLKLFRDYSNYKQYEIADYLGIERGAYANYESGSREMPYDLLVKISDFYGIDLSSLFEQDPVKSEENLVIAFRLKDRCEADLHEIVHFKKVVRNYLKICSY